MDILKIVKELSEQFDTEIVPIIKMVASHRDTAGYIGGGQTVYLNKDVGTIVKDMSINLTYLTPSLLITLVHTNCIRWTQGRIIKEVPHFCKCCGIEALSVVDAAKLGVPVNEKAKPSIEIRSIGDNYHQYNAIKQSTTVFDLYSFEGYWWHLCPALNVDRTEIPKNRYLYHYSRSFHSRMTARKFPHKCQKCKQKVGEGLKLNVAFKLHSMIGKK